MVYLQLLMLREHSNSTCYRKVRFYFVQLLYVPDQLPPLIGHNYIYTIWIHMSGALSATPLQKKTCSHILILRY